MINHILKFNEAAVTALAGSTRLRLNIKQRGGETFTALRPSYRVSGKNAMLLVEPVDGEKFQNAILSETESAKIANLPEFKPDAAYYMDDIGYGWFVLKQVEVEGDVDETRPGVYVTVIQQSDEKVVSPKQDELTQTSTVDLVVGEVATEITTDTSVVITTTAVDAIVETIVLTHSEEIITEPVVEPTANLTVAEATEVVDDLDVIKQNQ